MVVGATNYMGPVVNAYNPTDTSAAVAQYKTNTAPAEDGQYVDGVTVVEDEQSASGFTAHFIYDAEADKERAGIPEDATIISVILSGGFRLHDGNKVKFDKDSDDHGHGIDEYKPGDFAAVIYGNDMGVSYVTEYNSETKKYEKDLPMISGAHQYFYIVNYDVTDDNGEVSHKSVLIDDPKNESPCRANEANSDSYTDDINRSIVYGKWCEKQGSTPNLDYMTTYPDVARGTVQYVEYKGTKREHQDLGIYLPAGYDANRTEPYKVIYLSHGMGGNETYWMSQPQANNVMDNVIAENPDQEAIVVSMDNTLYNWDYYQIGENVTKYIIPYMEENYNVSKEAKDRAFAGFSMGSMTTTYMAFHHADKFGYFGIFSGCNIGNATFKDGFEYDASKLRGENGDAYLKEVYENIEPSQDLLDSVVYTQAGNYDSAVHANGFSLYGAYETIRDWGAQYMPEGHFIDGGLVRGSHDIYTWTQCLYNFAKDVVWSKEDNSNTPDQPTTPDQPENPSDTEKPSNDGQTTTDQPTVKPTTDTTTKVDKPTSSKVKTGDDTDALALVSMMVLAGGTVCLIKRKKETD